MPEVKKHLQGEPCWAELATSDEKGALKFYSAVFGWKDDPQPMGPGQVYHMQKLGVLTAAALYQMGEQEQGMPPHWRVYFAVDSADDTARKINAGGGKVVMAPFDVFDSGRMVVAQDPSGAFVSFWEAANHIGYTVEAEPGAVAWNELLTREHKQAVAFYKTVLGVDAADVPMPGITYTMIKVHGKEVAGIMQMPKEVPPMVPSYWSPYFAVVNCDASVQKVKSLGGQLMAPAQDVPGVGRFATVADAQGATFGIYQSAM